MDAPSGTDDQPLITFWAVPLWQREARLLTGSVVEILHLTFHALRRRWFQWRKGRVRAELAIHIEHIVVTTSTTRHSRSSKVETVISFDEVRRISASNEVLQIDHVGWWLKPPMGDDIIAALRGTQWQRKTAYVAGL